MTRHVVKYSPETSLFDPAWADRPLPITEPLDVWLEYPSFGMTILASVEPDSFFKEFVRNGGSTIAPDGATHQYFIAYSENHHDGTTVQRCATWRFVPSRGLMLGGETDLLEEIGRVGAHILGAIYQGSHDESDDTLAKRMGTVTDDASLADTAINRAEDGRIKELTVRVFKPEKHGFYPTPPALTLPMLRLEKFEGAIWEPACGDGAMSRELSKVCDKVISTDLICRSYGEGDVNFLKQDRLLAPNIVTNPPFKLWREFAKHAHRLGAQKIVLLNKLSIMGNKTHSTIMFETGLARVLFARGRVDILPPGAEDKGFGSRHGNYAWFIWERGHTGDPTIQWFTPAEGDGDS